MKQFLAMFALSLLCGAATLGQGPKAKVYNVNPPPIASDSSVKYDYDIVYVRAPRRGDNKQIAWSEVFSPLRAEPGSDLMLLHPDGKEEVLIAAGEDAITDPFVSFDGQSVYFARYHNVRKPGAIKPVSESADIFKIHVKSRKITQLTHQEFTPNTGVVSKGAKAAGIYNLGPCPLPGGKVIFTSNRNGFDPTKGYTPTVLQLFVMDDPTYRSPHAPREGNHHAERDAYNGEQNVELIGHLNINTALHPTILKDGRVMFTTYESQGLRDLRLWAVWTIHPDGTNWGPLVSAFGPSGDTAYHFMTQLSDESVVVEEYYNLNNMGFGTYYKMAPHAPPGQPFFGPASVKDERNLGYNGTAYNRIPFSPHKLEWLTPFCTAFDAPARLSDAKDPNSTRVGKVTHPSAAPDNHLLTVWSPGPVNSNNGLRKPAIDSGIYLLKSGKPIAEPGQLLCIKNDPNYNEQWPRALVPYKRIHGVDEPAKLKPLANDGKRSKHLPEGTPFGLVGTSSLYKRESYPHGTIPPGKVTATYAGGKDPFQGLGTLAYTGIAGPWFVQGSDTCRYENSEVHAIRILVTEPTTAPRYTAKGKRLWWNVANERLRILGEFPVRHFSPASPPTAAGGLTQPLDPDGNPDTSFLVKLPADIAWTFQTLDKNGMVLNFAQTWHQLRPGEVRHDCGGCHAHSQQPTPFEKTRAAQPDYVPFDLTQKTPLLTSKKNDQTGKQWDKDDATGVRFLPSPGVPGEGRTDSLPSPGTPGEGPGVRAFNVEYFRDIKPIFERSCAACHTEKNGKPAGNLVLDDATPVQGPQSIGGLIGGPSTKVPGTYVRLVLDHTGKFGNKSPVGNWPHPQASRYIRQLQARRSLLMWKVYGQRLDGLSNDDFAVETVAGDPNSLVYQGKPFPNKKDGSHRLVNLAYTGSIMPPPDAVKSGKVAPLTDEDKRTLARWIDLGCPIDLDYDAKNPAARGNGWLQDDNRPTLTLTLPDKTLTRVLVGMHDYDSGLDLKTFSVKADFAVAGLPAGSELAAKFQPASPGVWQLKLATPITHLPRGTLTVSVRDRQGNITRIERTFSVNEK